VRETLWAVAWRLTACGLATALLWQVFGVFAVLFLSPLYGMALARPLLELVSHTRRLTKHAAYAGVHGRHYSYKRTAIRVVEDADFHRWLCLDHARKVVQGLPSDAFFERHCGARFQAMGMPAQGYVRADQLLELLAKATAPETLRFRHWLAREVVFPSAKKRGP
jgi:phosphate/sulfate permease